MCVYTGRIFSSKSDLKADKASSSDPWQLNNEDDVKQLPFDGAVIRRHLTEFVPDVVTRTGDQLSVNVARITLQQENTPTLALTFREELSEK